MEEIDLKHLIHLFRKSWRLTEWNVQVLGERVTSPWPEDLTMKRSSSLCTGTLPLCCLVAQNPSQTARFYHFLYLDRHLLNCFYLTMSCVKFISTLFVNK